MKNGFNTRYCYDTDFIISIKFQQFKCSEHTFSCLHKSIINSMPNTIKSNILLIVFDKLLIVNYK